jgi:lysophospholipase L1-like esterase
VRNVGVSGQTTEDMIADAATQIDVFPRGILVAWEGGNDIYVDNADLAETQARWNAYFSARRAAGWGVGSSKLVAMTITPRTLFSGAQTIVVNNFNTWLRANYTTYATHLVDVAADSRLSNASNTTYYDADGVHMNTAGYAVVAQLVATAIA